LYDLNRANECRLEEETHDQRAPQANAQAVYEAPQEGHPAAADRVLVVLHMQALVHQAGAPQAVQVVGQAVAGEHPQVVEVQADPRVVAQHRARGAIFRNLHKLKTYPDQGSNRSQGTTVGALQWEQHRHRQPLRLQVLGVGDHQRDNPVRNQYQQLDPRSTTKMALPADNALSSAMQEWAQL
tara:strand:+ start:317613 stop:318161 length:549 start_codon:yes stop_codon:yes gene_type:complete